MKELQAAKNIDMLKKRVKQELENAEYSKEMEEKKDLVGFAAAAAQEKVEEATEVEELDCDSSQMNPSAPAFQQEETFVDDNVTEGDDGQDDGDDQGGPRRGRQSPPAMSISPTDKPVTLAPTSTISPAYS